MINVSNITPFVLSHEITLWITTFLLGGCAFRFMRRIVRGPTQPPRWVYLFFSAVNASIVLLLEQVGDGRTSPLVMVVISAVVVAQLSLVSRDSWWPYVSLYFMFLLELLGVYSFSCAIINIMLRSAYIQGSDAHRYAIFSLTMLLATLLLFASTYSRAAPISSLSDLLHSKSRSLLLLIYLVLCSTVLLISAEGAQSLVYSDTLPREVEIIMHTDIAMKDGLILVCSFLIILVQIWQEEGFQRNRELKFNLQREMDFRTSTQKEALISYCANVTKNDIEAGWECFSDRLNREDGYVEMMKHFALHCVHRDDWNLLLRIGNPAYFQERLLKSPSYDLRMRISPKRMLEVLRFPEDARQKLESSEKEWLWVNFHAIVTSDAASGDIYSYVSLTDIDEAVREESALRRAAHTDALTGLLNRAALRDAISEHLAGDNPCGTLFLMDMDKFKNVNDIFGHPAGDRLLKEIAVMLRTVFRDGDAISRLGGDEFCVFAPGLRNRDRIDQLAGELNRLARRTYIDKAGRQFQTALSIGVAICPDHAAADYRSLYQCADQALYQAKAAGRDTFRYYAPKEEDIPDEIPQELIQTFPE